MAKSKSVHKKERFRFTAMKSDKGRLKRGDTGPDVRALQTILTDMGYLRRDRIPGEMCDKTSAALHHFQKCYGLPETGDANPQTLELLSRPRCGVPDIPLDDGARHSGPAPFVLRGCKYDRTDLTYAFVNRTPDLTAARQQEIVREAFAIWAAVSPLRFIEVGAGESPAFSIAWERGNHGDGSPFDEGGTPQGNTLAHAFYPPPCGGNFAGALHFDEFERWTDAAAPNAIRLLNVAIHEIGHLLGLNHSNLNDAIMFAFYSDGVDSLRQDDINGIQALYGRPAGALPIRGQLAGDGDSQVHKISAQPGLLQVMLRGPAGQDFDLYVRAGVVPTRTSFDGRGFTASPNEEIVVNISGGDVFIMVDSWRGSGPYELLISAGQ